MNAYGIQIDLQEMTELCRQYRINKLALFGSVLREDFGPDSDVDVLVEFAPNARVGLIKFAEIEDALSRLIGRKVDLNTQGFLSPYFRDEVAREAEVIYDAA